MWGGFATSPFRFPRFAAENKSMRMFQNAIFAVSRFAAYVAAAIIVYMLLHVLLEILLRNIFHTSTFILEEMVGYAVAASSFLGLGYCLERGALIRVTLLLGRFAENSIARRVVEGFCVISTLFVTGLAIWQFSRSILRLYDRGYTSGTMSNIPSWIPETIMTVGLVLFWIQLVAHLLRVLGGSTRFLAENELPASG
jgi:TRAP-type C4-dicarboxylate transport system permease small subunit